MPAGLLENGHVLVENGKVACADCDCSGHPSYAGATIVACENALISPGLINAHEHITFGEGSPIDHDPERFEHRHDWREGNNGHTELPTPRSSQGDEGVLWAELRHLVSGATSVNGSGGVSGFLRNVDRQGLDEGLMAGRIRYDTFPLDDASGTTRTNSCDYGDIVQPTDSNIANAIAFTPHVAEGIGDSARNEFACLSGEGMGSTDVIMDKTAIIHGVGMTAADYASMGAEGASLIWSPRTNIQLYGHTAPVTLAKATGVQIALGTDWPASGSMNMTRELACAAEYNQRNLGGFFTDREILDMATTHAASVLKLDSVVGSLAPGRFADIAIYDARQNAGYQAALRGEPATVALVMRGGTPLYGDAALMTALTNDDAGCESVDICAKEKRLCAVKDTGMSVAQLRAGISPNTIDFFACGAPAGEPSCTPFRMGEFDGIAVNGDADGDGFEDANDNCPNVFNPPRQMDRGVQANADGDSLGDVCDPCPLDADSTACSAPDPNDRDNDGHPNATDNCPQLANPDQADRDMDMIGDACDECPDEANRAAARAPRRSTT